MPIDVDGHRGVGYADAVGEPLRLDTAASELYADLRLSPLLRRLVEQSRRLLGAMAGSISLVDSGRDRYAKMAEQGASCRLGQTFSLGEGVTGQVVAGQRPVVLEKYSVISRGHLPATHPASSGAVAAVPIWWRGDVIGANVVFAGRHRRYTAAEVDELEVLTHVAAPGIVKFAVHDPSLGYLLSTRREPELGVDTRVSEVGRTRPVSASVAGVAVTLVTLSERAAARRGVSARIHVAVVYGPEGLRLLVQDESVDVMATTFDSATADPATYDPATYDPATYDPVTHDPVTHDPLGIGTQSWHDLVASVGGAGSVERVPGWGTLLRVDFPYEPTPRTGLAVLGGTPSGSRSPFTARESDVLDLLAQGLSNGELAKRLLIAPKTVEKHVGAILRKTGSTSRTAATLMALERGWVRPAGSVPLG